VLEVLQMQHFNHWQQVLGRVPRRELMTGRGVRPFAPIGPMLAAALLGSFALLKPALGQGRAWALLGLGAGVLGMLLTGTRGLLPLAFGLMLMPLYNLMRFAHWQQWVGFGAALFAIGFLACFGPARPALLRLLALPLPGADAVATQSLERRLWLARPVWALVNQRPFLGYGAGPLAAVINSPDVGAMNVLLFGGWALAISIAGGIGAWVLLHWPRRLQALHVHALAVAVGFGSIMLHTNMLFAGPQGLATVVLVCAALASMGQRHTTTQAAKAVQRLL